MCEALVAATETGVSKQVVSYHHHATSLTAHNLTYLQHESVFGASHPLGQPLVWTVLLVPFLLTFS